MAYSKLRGGGERKVQEVVFVTSRSGEFTLFHGHRQTDSSECEQRSSHLPGNRTRRLDSTQPALCSILQDC